MSNLDDGRRILADAEVAMQEILANAASERDYGSAAKLADWAREIASLLEGPAANRPPVDRSLTESPRLPARKKRRTTASGKGYPRFIKDCDRLVKVGWSKSNKCEYEHAAQREIVNAVISSMLRAGKRGNRFTMEDVLPVEDLDGVPVPHYQAYLVLGWLREAELVEQHGRLGYTIIAELELVDEVEDCWARLANRNHEHSGRSS